MDPKHTAKLNEINREFYQKFGRDFASTRRKINPGVARVIRLLPKEARILDLGCGSGALALELAAQGQRGSYLGLDFSEEELEIARETVKRVPRSDFGVGFESADLLDGRWAIGLAEGSFDAVLAFAFLHHIPGAENREQILRSAHRLLKPGGIFVHSQWQFQHSPSLWARRQPWNAAGIDPRAVDVGDHLLDWRHGAGTDANEYGLRYVHLFNREELAVLASQTGFEIVDEFESDGKGGRLGLYQTWRKEDQE